MPVSCILTGMDFLLKSIASLLFQVVEIRLPTPVLADSGSKSFLVSLRISATVSGTPVVFWQSRAIGQDSQGGKN